MRDKVILIAMVLGMQGMKLVWRTASMKQMKLRLKRAVAAARASRLSQQRLEKLTGILMTKKLTRLQD
jgi:hypothetical protein